MNISRLALMLIVGIGFGVLLVYLESILEPLFYSVFIWFIIKEMRDVALRSRFVEKHFPIWLLNIVSFLFIFAVIGALSVVLAANIRELLEALPSYKRNIPQVLGGFYKLFGIDLEKAIAEGFPVIKISEILNGVFSSLSGFLVDLFLVILFVVFLLTEESLMPDKLKLIYKTDLKYRRLRLMLLDLDKSISKYIAMKTLISLITGFVCYIILLISGLDFPVLWGVVIFLLNYIPNIGSIIATVLPSLMALLQFGEWSHFFAVFFSVGAAEAVLGNYVDPRLMGTTLNISSLVVLIALVFWGLLWGVGGMFLSVPLTSMLIILFSRFRQTRNIAILLSGTGEVNHYR